MKLLVFVIALLLVERRESHDHGHHHGDTADHFHEDEHLEDHRHWYTKEANEKLQEALKDSKKKETKPSSENEPLAESEGSMGEGTGLNDGLEKNPDVRGDTHEHSNEKIHHGSEQANDQHSHGKHDYSEFKTNDQGHSHQGHSHHEHSHQEHKHHGHSHHGHGHSHHGHGHSHHGHGDSHHGHGHSHGHHGHSHDHHGHNQGHHGHSHHGHGHSHHGHGHSHHGHGDSHHGHGHSHGHHGHSHDHHGHNQGHHGHSHHGHGHSHHGHGHSHHGHGDSHHGHGHSHGHHGHSHDHHGHNQGHHGHSHEGQKHRETAKATVQNSKGPAMEPLRYVWLESILSTCLISAAPFFILFFVPLESNSEEQRPLLKVLLSFASGGLLGDAFLHLIPHAVSPHSHNVESGHSHSHGHSHVHEGEHPEHAHDHSADMIVGLWVLAGMLAFLIVEKFVRHVKGDHSHSHGHAHLSSKADDDVKVVKSSRQTEDNISDVKERKKEGNDNADMTTKPEVEVHSNEAEGIKVSGYLNLAADFTHNFTDGLAIGASYLVSRNVGLVTTLTILLHEVPHEIGDFAILVQSGCSKRKAMWLQLTTATGALAGTLCGLLAENIGNTASSGILPFTAGGFIYIATVSVIPELLEDANPRQSFKEVVALLIGVLLMVFIALLE